MKIAIAIFRSSFQVSVLFPDDLEGLNLCEALSSLLLLQRAFSFQAGRMAC